MGLLSRKRFVVVRKQKKIDPRRDIIEFTKKEEAMSFAVKSQRMGMKPEVWLIKLTWPEWIDRIAAHLRGRKSA